MSLSIVKKKKDSQIALLYWALFALLLFRTWSFIFMSTDRLEYASYLLVFVLFVYMTAKYKIQVNTLVAVCLPYMTITLLDLLLIHPNYERMTYWLAPIIMLLVASRSRFLEAIPLKLIFWSAFIAMIGVYVQFIFLPFYNAVFAPYIKAEMVLSLEDVSGLRGFTPQQGTTSIILIFGEVVTLYLKERAIPKYFQKKLLYWFLVALIVLAIFLTGKRTISAIAIVMPLLVFLFSANRGKQRFWRIFLLSVLLVVGYRALPLLLRSTNIYVFQRFADTIEIAQAGGDYTSHREILWDAAMDAFHKHPVFGIGVCQYNAYTQMGTDTHNTYIQVLCEQGMVGFTLYVLGLLCTLLLTIRILDKTTDPTQKSFMKAALATELVYILYAYTGNVNIDVDVIMFYLAIAIAIRVDALQRVKRIKI